MKFRLKIGPSIFNLIIYTPVYLFSNWLARLRLPAFVLKFFVWVFDINLSAAKNKNLTDYQTFLEIFLREPETIQLDSCPVVSPCQGTVEYVFSKNVFQSSLGLKGFLNVPDFEGFQSGIGIYLSPRDFHIVYSPVNGRVQKISHINGPLSTVNKKSIGFSTENCFLNKRLVLDLGTDISKVRFILVGAIGVGTLKLEPFVKEGADILQGQKIFQFELGSFVWLLFERDLEISTKTGELLTIGEALIQFA